MTLDQVVESIQKIMAADSTQISARFQTIAFGVLAGSWAMLLTGNHKGDLCFKIAIVVAIFSIIFDLGQYLWRYCYLWRKIDTYKKRQKKEGGSTEIATPVFSQLGAIEILYFGKLVLTAISAVVFFLGCIPFIFYS